MSKTETQELVVKVRKGIQECLNYLESALEMLNHATTNPNYLLGIYADLKNASKKIKELEKAMKELEKMKVSMLAISETT